MSEPGWVTHAIWWHLYPLGFVGAFPAENGEARADEHRLRRIVPWFDHALKLGASGIALGPIFASQTHGYDTVDYFAIDQRLGDDSDFDYLIAEARGRGLRVLLDGVFNHVSATFSHPEWFRHESDGTLGTFEGHAGLIALDHDNSRVQDHVVDVMRHWLDRGANGWRLDAAYAVPADFWSSVIPRVRQTHPEAWFVGEVIHGDYPSIVADDNLDSVTQYELWKAIWSSLNDQNPHELAWALTRHDGFVEAFIPTTFLGNHDVTRLASRLVEPRQREQALVILLTVAGTPMIYAGDEYAFRGIKEDRVGGDDAIRPEFSSDGRPSPSADLTTFRLHQELIGLRRRHAWLHAARTTMLEVGHRHLVYESRDSDRAVLVELNFGMDPVTPAAVSGRGEVVARSSDAPPSGELPPFGWRVTEIA